MLRHLRCGLSLPEQMSFGPGRGNDLRGLVVGHPGQTREHVFEVSVGINVAATAAFDDGVKDGSAFAGICLTHEEPVLLAQGRRANGIFYHGGPLFLDARIITMRLALMPRPLHPKLPGMMSDGIGESVPYACQDWANTEAAYRSSRSHAGLEMNRQNR
jgi:Transposase DNA-binding